MIADYQVIADRDGVGPIRERVRSLVTDYLAVGLDPDRTTIFTHSAVPELHQLLLPFLSLVTDAELRRNPTVKAEHLATGGRPMSGLLLTYPVHQAADILFCKANVVPVGKDQLPHLEQARVIARRFDQRYGRLDPDTPVFPIPEALLSPAVNLLGVDGHKMSKSRGNSIDLAMDADTTARRVARGGHRWRPVHHLRPGPPAGGGEPRAPRARSHQDGSRTTSPPTSAPAAGRRSSGSSATR